MRRDVVDVAPTTSVDRRWTVERSHGSSMDGGKIAWIAVLGRSFEKPKGEVTQLLLSASCGKMHLLSMVADGFPPAAWIRTCTYFDFQTFAEAPIACMLFFQPCIYPKELDGETLMGTKKYPS